MWINIETNKITNIFGHGSKWSNNDFNKRYIYKLQVTIVYQKSPEKCDKINAKNCQITKMHICF